MKASQRKAMWLKRQKLIEQSENVKSMKKFSILSEKIGELDRKIGDV